MESRNQRKILLINMVLAALILSTLFYVFESTGASNYDYNAFGNGVDIWGKVYHLVLNDYVEEVDPEDLALDGVNGMLENLDPYTSFFIQRDFKQLEEDSKGEFAGLGIMIGPLNDYPTVMEPPIEDSPAMKNGMTAGDAIVEIEGKSTFKMPINDVVGKLRGEVNTIVNIAVKRGNREDLIKLSIKREKIPLKNILYSGEIEKDIGYIKLTKFNAEAPSEMRDSLEVLLENDNIKGVILDLRLNPGGLLNVAHEISNMFLPKNSLIVYTKGRNSSENREFLANKMPILPQKPLVVLINRGSASASEIVAGAIQDWDRGVLVGETTFGKGLVQTLHPLSEGAGLKLTTAKYYTPSGRCIQRDNFREDMVAFSEEEEELRGSVESEEDSLKQHAKFFTKTKERVVYEGGGVTPDIIVKEKPVGNIITQFAVQSVFYDFAFLCKDNHPDLKQDFEITEELVNEFKEYISDEKVFKYEIPGKSYLDNFKKTIEREEYDGDVLDMIAGIEKTLAERRDDDFDANIDTIKRILKREISGTMFGSSTRIKATKEWDVQLLKAIEILQNPDMYNSILSEGAETGVVAEVSGK